MIKDKRTMEIVTEVMKLFVGMVIALAWDGAIRTIISIIKESFPFAGILLSFLYAIFITVVALFIVVFILKKIDNTEKESENN
ncbi:DUF5654 family protein [Candidatus Absconditicoccus praedator]|uniref:DUF5654 family protein n=1 Tax=Candidatus Absconditicoccus praedator TaxID=2735562 RepID=UPI001E473AAF|nr:DUF5654 family protein [Candidatus Absconditicoccus praedator]UFX82898.1 hypothetical protein HLG78_02070 [Candidatus Absconditicoccus praedator]